MYNLSVQIKLHMQIETLRTPTTNTNYKIDKNGKWSRSLLSSIIIITTFIDTGGWIHSLT